MASPLPLYRLIMKLMSQSVGIWPSAMKAIYELGYHETANSNGCFKQISHDTWEEPGDFPDFILEIASMIITPVTRIEGPETGLATGRQTNKNTDVLASWHLYCAYPVSGSLQSDCQEQKSQTKFITGTFLGSQILHENHILVQISHANINTLLDQSEPKTISLGQNILYLYGKLWPVSVSWLICDYGCMTIKCINNAKGNNHSKCNSQYYSVNATNDSPQCNNFLTLNVAI